MSIKVGDIVKHDVNGKSGEVVSVINDMFIEVQIDNDIYYWHTANVNIVKNTSDFDDWDPDYGYWDNNYSFKMAEPRNKKTECTCDSWTLLHFGCKCGFMEQEKEDALQRQRGGSDLDRKDG